MQFLLSRLGLTTRDEAELEYERRQGRLFAVRAARTRLDEMHSDGTISETTWKQLEPHIEEEMRRQLAAQRELLERQPQLRHEEFADARREALRAERAALAKLLSDGIISEAIYEELVTEVDRKIADAGAFETAPASAAEV